MKNTMRRILAIAFMLTMIGSIFPEINPGVGRVFAIDDAPSITSGVYSVDEGNLLIGELQDNAVHVDSFKNNLNASPEGASIQVYTGDGTTLKTGFMAGGDKVKVSYNGIDRVYTVETYQVVDGEKIYPGFVAEMSGHGYAPGDDDATAQAVPLGFIFNYFDSQFTGAYIDINGFISFNELAMKGSDVLNYSDVFTRDAEPYNIIAAFLSDITMQNISEDKVNNPQYVPSIYYKTIGTAPNRQFIAQWTNMYFWQGSIQFADFQVILSEGSDKIQLQYRTLLDVDNPYYGVQHGGLGANATVGLKGPSNPPEQVYYSIGGKDSENQSILLHQGQAICFTPDGAGGYTMEDNDVLYEKVYLQNPLAPVASHINEADGMIPDNAVGVGKDATIGWGASDLAERYRLAVARTESFSDIEYNVDGITDTYFQFGGAYPLDSNTTYYWKVESVNDRGSSFSPVYRFTTADYSGLSSLSSDAGVWNASFASGTYEYTISVPNSVSGIAFTPVPMDESSVVRVNDAAVAGGAASDSISLGVGSNTVVIVVTTSDSTTRTYTITVNREPEAAPVLEGFTWGTGGAAGTTRATAVPSGTLRYAVGAAGELTRPNPGDASTAYTNLLAVNNDIEVSSGQHIYIVSVDSDGKILAWADVAVDDADIKAGGTENPTHGGGNDSDSSSSEPVPATVNGSVIDSTTGDQVSTIQATVLTDEKGKATVLLNALQAVVLEKPSGEKSTLSDPSNIAICTAAGTPVAVNNDGTVQVRDLARGTQENLSIMYDLGNGQKIIIGTIDIKVADDGEVSLTSTLIDPYGTLTDSLSGDPIAGANVTLYYDDTARNKSAGIIPDTVVQLPIIDGFKPNNNKNPQTTGSDGAYGFMVYPNTDYYIVVSKDGYDTYKSPSIAVGEQLVKFSAKLNVPVIGVKRVAGDTRVDTAIQIAKSGFKGKVNNVVLATADDYPDALAGSVLAYQQNAPILLVGNTREDQNKVLEYMKANLNPAGNVYILGGIGVIGEDVAWLIKSEGFANTVRLGGIDRYETAAKIADSLKVEQGTPVVLVSGENYPDALSVSSPAAINQHPILLVNDEGISDYVRNALAAIKPNKVYIIGEQGAIGSIVKNQAEQAASLGADSIVRIGGADRYETAVAIAKYFSLSGQNICVTTGSNFPDCLAGSMYAANFNAPIIFADDSLCDCVMNYLKTRKITGATILGGEAPVSMDIEQKLLQMIGK